MKKKLLNINNKYTLSPLTKIINDDISFILKNNIGVYICNFPSQNWYDHHKLIRHRNYSLEKKLSFFSIMKEGSFIISPTQDSLIKEIRTNSFTEDNISHIGYVFNNRLKLLELILKIFKVLFKKRKTYNYILVYNFYPIEILAAFLAKLFLRKKIILDFEDDYTTINTSHLYSFYFNLVKRIPDQVIVVNKEMTRHFSRDRCFIFNGFIDLSYTKNLDFEFFNGIILFYSGTLDTIRGIDLIPDLVVSLKKHLTNFTIYISGSGPLENLVKSWNFEEVIFLGFLSDSDYNHYLTISHAFLVLQKPDCSFSKGSFPSKIETYSKHKKPIYCVVNNFNQ